MNMQTRWPDLLPDLLRDISGRLHHSIDFVRFHVVCRSWRDSHDPTKTQHFLPWLLSTSRTHRKKPDSLRLTCVFSNTSYRAPPLPAYRNWVAHADGTTVRYLGEGDHPHSSLHHPLTGATSLIPTIPDGLSKYRRPHGVVYRNGTILLYDKFYSYDVDDDDDDGDTIKFWAALLRPGNDSTWTVIKRTLEAFQYGKFCVAYHGGKILVSAGPSQWHAVALNDDVACDILIPNPWTPAQGEEYFYMSGHIMESRGELLWASLHIREDFRDWSREGVCNMVHALSLSVYVLQEEVSSPQKLRWVKMNSKSLAARVMFLGWSNSFAVDASRFSCDGGCAYFVYSVTLETKDKWCAVFRYNLIDNKAEFVEWLGQGWEHDHCAWLIPQPTIAPAHSCTMQL